MVRSSRKTAGDLGKRLPWSQVGVGERCLQEEETEHTRVSSEEVYAFTGDLA